MLETQVEIPALPDGHPAWRVIQESQAISTETLSYLVATWDRRVVSQIRTEWLLWLGEHAELTSQMQNWMEAWWTFWDCRKK